MFCQNRDNADKKEWFLFNVYESVGRVRVDKKVTPSFINIQPKITLQFLFTSSELKAVRAPAVKIRQ